MIHDDEFGSADESFGAVPVSSRQTPQRTETVMLSKLLPQNEHMIDRAIRVVLGVGLISLAFVGPQTLFGWVGLVPLVTGLVGSCPIYALLGVGTCKVPAKT